MCGRFTIALDAVTLMQLIEAEYDLSTPLPKTSLPRYNVAPSQEVPIYQGNALTMMRFGFKTSYGKEVINARGETIHIKPLFKTAFLSQRALVFADGFYEWRTTPYGKEAYRITMKDRPIFAMAAIAHGTDNEAAFAIVTTQANATIQALHNRMPVILDRDAAHAWLDPHNDSKTLKELLKPYSDESLHMDTVSPRVNKTDVDDEKLIEPIAPTPRLF